MEAFVSVAATERNLSFLPLPWKAFNHYPKTSALLSGIQDFLNPMSCQIWWKTRQIRNRPLTDTMDGQGKTSKDQHLRQRDEGTQTDCKTDWSFDGEDGCYGSAFQPLRMLHSCPFPSQLIPTSCEFYIKLQTL